MNKNKELILTLVINVIFTLFAVTAMVIMAAIAYKDDVFQSPEFWIITGLNTTLLIFLYNFYRSSNIRIGRKSNKGYRKSVIIHARMTDKIKGSKEMKDDLATIVEITNNNNWKEACAYKLSLVNSILTLEEALNMSDDKLLEFCKKEHIKAKRWWPRKGLLQVINQIKNGKVKYLKYTVHEVMNNQESESVNKSISSKSEKWILLRENILKMITYVLLTAAIATMEWDGNVSEIVKEIVLRGTLVFSAVWSAIRSASSYVGRRKDRIQNKNYVLGNVSGINYEQINNEADKILLNELQNET